MPYLAQTPLITRASSILWSSDDQRYGLIAIVVRAMTLDLPLGTGLKAVPAAQI
ncbi:MAG: hypothetical protein ACYCS1_10455 [Gammaproteobacteria bacterium]